MLQTFSKCIYVRSGSESLKILLLIDYQQSSDSFSGEIYFWYVSYGEWIVTGKKEFIEDKDRPGRWLWKKSQGKQV